MNRIAINALCITNRSGTGRYTYGFLDGMVRGKPDALHLTALIPAGFQIPKQWRLCPFLRFFSIPIRCAVERIFWEQFRLPSFLRQQGIKVLHSPAFIAPCLLSDSIRHLITVHDTAYLQHAETIPRLRATYLRWMIRRSIHRAAAVMTDSHAVAEEFKRLYRLPLPVHPIHLGVDETRFHPGASSAESEILMQHHLTSPYFLFVGTLEPRKNIPTLLEAYQAARACGLRHLLVVVGRYGWRVDPRALRQEGVIWLGYMEEAHLPILYRNADALAAPSLYEGFDLPVVEALACGTRVIASDIPVHREVLGGDGRLVAPLDIQAWKEALLQPTPHNPGKHRPRTWIETARETAMVYLNAK